MRNGTWLEVAVNGPWGRSRQPGIPVRVQEIVAEGAACAAEGAAIERSGGRLASAAEVRAALPAR